MGRDLADARGVPGAGPGEPGHRAPALDAFEIDRLFMSRQAPQIVEIELQRRLALAERYYFEPPVVGLDIIVQSDLAIDFDFADG